MKKFILSLCFFCPALVFGTTILPQDTVIYTGGKKIVIRENNEKIKVKIFEKSSKNDTIEDQQVFEGIYRDGQTTERRMNDNFVIPKPHLNYSRSGGTSFSDAHWGGFNLGFNRFVNTSNVPGLDLRQSTSIEFAWNFFECSWALSHNGLGLVSGTGLTWNNFSLKGNKAFQEVNDVTALLSSAGGGYKSSHLNITYVTVPLLLEYQTHVPHSKKFFISAGPVVKVKIYGSSKAKYVADNGNTEKLCYGHDLNIRPLALDLMGQIGVGDVGFYTKYSPESIFSSGKGPKLNPISFGVFFNF
jgi:hypothetical protein